MNTRPIGPDKLLSISCHNAADLRLTDALGADRLLLCPIKLTASHPDLPGLGWERFPEMTEGLKQPVYGLGGMQAADVENAKAAARQGIAATKGYRGGIWRGPG